MADWRFYLMEMPSREWIDKELPLAGAKVIRNPNAPAAISGSLPEGLTSLYDAEGELRLVEWGCAIVAEREGSDPVFCIVDEVVANGSVLEVQAGGFSMYPKDMPWLGPEFIGIDVDPLDMVRKIWDHLLSYENSGLSVAVDDTTSPPSAWIGEEEEDVNFTTGTGEVVSFEAGPFRLARWNVSDLGATITKLQEETPFDYREHSSWNGDEIEHRLELGYPGLGVRQYDLTFEIGYNVVVPPPVQSSDYASEIWMQGAGEGRDKLKTSAHLTVPTKRMRRVHVETDKEVKSVAAANRAGRPKLALLSGQQTIDTIEIIDHDLAPFGSYKEGDEIRVTGDAGWVELDTWVRILEIQDDCTTDRRTLKVEVV